MPSKVIPVADLRYGSVVPDVSGPSIAPTGRLADTLGRPLRDLRISVTDRCNFRCVYCMPRAVFDKNYAFLPYASLLTFEEIERAARLFVAHGVEKIRLTGGEPLLRKNLEILIEKLAKLATPSGRKLDLTLTTNGALLARKARSLKNAGLTRITVSLDALDKALFMRMNDADFPVTDVLNGIDAALSVELAPVKINMVVKRGTNDHEILPMARHFKDSGAILRFIEYMDVGASNGWNMTEVLPSSDVIARIAAELPLLPLGRQAEGETAQRWRYADGRGEIGVISSVTQAFCHSCNRARLSTEGRLYLCLFANRGYDLRSLLRQGASDAHIETALAKVWQSRTDRYSALRTQPAPNQTGKPGDTATRDPKRVEMSYIGG